MAQLENIIGNKTGLLNVIERVNIVAPKNVPVLLHGETGSGKEVIAQLIHDRSTRGGNVFKRVNCGAISRELIDSELFGHEKGAFTGTSGMHRGWFEQADKGTLFLDEVAELSGAAQVRLLRVLQDGTFTRVGGEKVISTNVRVIAATHQNLPLMIENREFREDLYYRLSVFPIVIPPLRDRKEDIGELAVYFIGRAVNKFGVKPMTITPKEVEELQKYSWPGNIREFASVINRAVLLGEATGRLQISKALGTFTPIISPLVSNKKTENCENSEDETLHAVISCH
ncbi:MAG: sigma 54-interacting transcriptional regulator, partial [Deltaproteobacteria bacterium]|nr:sigma 54-interacting transcriptional regulator [Deltaproteobacteria bacterium]